MNRLASSLPLCILALTACDESMLSQADDPPDAGSSAADADVDPEDAGSPPDAIDPLVATEPVYLHTNRRLYSYDPMSNVATRIGNFHTESGSLADMVDIAINLDGYIFGGTANADIFRVDPRDGSCRYVTTSDMSLTGMTFLSDGRLVAAGEGVAIIDLESGFITEELVGSREHDYRTSGDIIGLPDGALYWAVEGQIGEGDGLVRIDPQTDEVRFLGSGSVSALYGLGYAYGTLYGFSPEGIVAILDTTTGTVVEQRPLEGRWFGATTNPVLW